MPYTLASSRLKPVPLESIACILRGRRQT